MGTIWRMIKAVERDTHSFRTGRTVHGGPREGQAENPDGYQDIWNRIVKPAVGSTMADKLNRLQVNRLHSSLAGTPFQANRVLAVVLRFGRRDRLRACWRDRCEVSQCGKADGKKKASIDPVHEVHLVFFPFSEPAGNRFGCGMLK
jgi:hypothetical protein